MKIVLAFLVVLLVLGTAAYYIFDIFRAITMYFFRDYIARLLIFRKLNRRSLTFLHKNFAYYKRLSSTDKKVFEKRVQKFMDMKEFVARGSLREVTHEMRTLIGAAAVFGWN